MTQGFLRTTCLSCGTELEPWFDTTETLYDVSRDDEAYERWLDTPCFACRKTPRDNGQR
jgi:hypothetical protein